MKTILFLFIFFLLPAFTFSQSQSWQTVGLQGFSEGMITDLSLAINPVTGQPWVSYVDVAAGSGNLGPATVMKFDGTSWVTVGPQGFTTDNVGYTDLAFDTDGIPYLVYGSSCSSPHHATVMKFINNTWTFVGIEGFSENSASYTSIAISPEGYPYVVFLDQQYEHKATAMKFNGDTWENVGPPRFSPGEAWEEEIAFSGDTPYVAFWNYPGRTASVMKFNGTAWEAVGSPQCTGPNTLLSKSLAINPIDGKPYLAYCDSITSSKITVISFDGVSWSPVGQMGFSTGYSSSITMAFSPIGEPYVFYWDNYLTNTIVQKFDGANWVMVGSPNLSGGYVEYTDIAFSPSGAPFVSYQDYIHESKATVKKYDFPVWYEEKQGTTLSIYPNPVRSALTIELPTTISETKKIEISNLQGELIYSCHSDSDKISLNIQDLPNGVYLLRVTTSRAVFISKIIKT